MNLCHPKAVRALTQGTKKIIVEEIVFKLSPIKRAVKINWDHVEQLNIKDLNLKFMRDNEIIGEFNMIGSQ